MKLIEDKFFEDEVFDYLVIENYEIRHCIFIRCSFKEVQIKNCLLHANTYRNCTITQLQTEFTELIQAIFEDCRLIGVHWGNLQSSISYRPLIAKMEGNYLKYNTFSVSNLEKMDFQTNTFHQTVFEECNLMQTKWNDCDLRDCEIVKSNLKKADLRDSFGFHIDLKTCQVENTQISSFEALSLLSQLGIDVD